MNSRGNRRDATAHTRRRGWGAFARVALALALVCGLAPGAWLQPAAQAIALTGNGPAISAQAKDKPSAGSGDDAQAKQDEKDEKAIEEVLKLVKGLPSPANVKASDADAVQKASDAYDSLTDDQKKKFGKEHPDEKELLGAVKEALGERLADKEAADGVIALINALPDPSAATAGDRAAVDAAQAAFGALTDSQKGNISQAEQDKLAQVSAAVAAAEKEASSSSAAQPDPPQGSSSSAEGEPTDQGSSAASQEEAASSSTSSARGDYRVSVLLMKWDEPDDNGERHFVGDGPIVEDAYRSIDIAEFGQTVQLTGWYASTDGTGVIYQTSDSSTDIGSFELTWKSSDEKIATVSPSGLVTPRGKNGTVKITATVADKKVYDGKAPSTTVAINFDGQEGRYVTQVDILNDKGEVIGERWGGVTLFGDKEGFHQLHARVTWHDAKTGQDTTVDTGTGDDYSAKRVDTTVEWNVSTSSAFTINEKTGRLRTGSYSGNAYVTCTVVGGAAGATVTDTASVQLDTGEYEYNPASGLDLKVVYEERPDEVVKEASYTYEELLGLLATKHVNATVVNESRFGVISADGFLFKDVVDLVAVDDADVLQYRFTTADGYDNPVSYAYLFESGPRYYFPNYDLGGSQADGEIVPPVLAYSSAMEWGRSQANPSAKLDDGNRFRLVFGCLASGDANTSFQIYYINAITVVLKGAPPAGGDGGEGEGGEGDDPGKEGEGEGGSSSSSAAGDPSASTSASSGSRDGSGSASSSAAGESASSSSSSAADDNRSSSSASRDDEEKPGGARSASADDQARQEQVQQPEERQPAEEAKRESAPEDAGTQDDVRADGADIDTAKKWRVYQMMNKTNSDVPDWDDENPLSPFAAPIAVGTFAVGAGVTGIGFRRRLK